MSRYPAAERYVPTASVLDNFCGALEGLLCCSSKAQRGLKRGCLSWAGQVTQSTDAAFAQGMDRVQHFLPGSGDTGPLIEKALKRACTQERSAVTCRQALEGKSAVFTLERGASQQPLLGTASLSGILTSTSDQTQLQSCLRCCTGWALRARILRMRERGAPRGTRCWAWQSRMGAAPALPAGLLPASPPPPGQLPGQPRQHLFANHDRGAGFITCSLLSILCLRIQAVVRHLCIPAAQMSCTHAETLVKYCKQILSCS